MSFSGFLRKNGEDGYEFEGVRESFVDFLGKEVMNGFRLHEVDIIQSLISDGAFSPEPGLLRPALHRRTGRGTLCGLP